MARNGADNVRKPQRALYRKSKQDKEGRFYSLYDKLQTMLPTIGNIPGGVYWKPIY
jgi:hypothetical protein